MTVASTTAILLTPRPRFTAEEASELASSLFAIGGPASELGSERDQAFRIGDGAQAAILKISNERQPRIELDFELELLRHINRTDPALPVPRHLPLAAPEPGETAYIGVARRGASEHLVRITAWLEGVPQATGAALDDHSVRHLGQTIARLGHALRGFFHPAAGRRLLWDVAQVPEVLPLVDRIAQPRQRALAKDAMERFQRDALPQWRSLRCQIVHGDLNIENVLFDQAGEVCAILDFGDALHGPLLGDVASALSSVMRNLDAPEAFRAARIFLDGYRSTTPLEEVETALLGVTLSARLASLLTVASWKSEEQPENAPYFHSLIRDCRHTLELLEEAGIEAVDRALGVATSRRSSAALRQARHRLLGPALSELFYDNPVHVASARGTWLVDVDGRPLLDAYNNVASVGHCHPRVTEAVVNQTRKLNTHTRYLYEPLVELAELLIESIHPQHGLDTVMILNSGSEANDLAWRLATSSTAAQGAIVSDWAYHGMTAVVSDLSPQQWPEGRHPHHVETFAVPTGGSGADREVSAAEGVKDAIARLAGRGIAPAAMYIDGAFTSEGVLTPSPNDINRCVQLARAAGALIVADEVQAGHGRSGIHLWSFEKYGYTPDFITMGKPMGNGYPVAAMVTRSEIAAEFASGKSEFAGGKYYFSTFGGNPVAARAAIAVLKVIEDERLIDRVATVGGALTVMLARLRDRHPAIAEIRCHGTLIGVHMNPIGDSPPSRTAERTVNGLRASGVLVGRTGRHDDVLKIRPPLVFDRQDATILVDALDRVLTDLL